MINKRIMIIGASAWQVPMIQKAKDLGYEVAVVDIDPNAVGIEYADKFYHVSTNDKKGVYLATKDFHASGITTVATDMPMRAIAYTCKMLGLKGISEETAINSTDKEKMIKKFEEFCVPHPWYYVVSDNNINSIRDAISYPCICKPVDNSGSRGVIVINSEHELLGGINYSSSNGRSGTVIIEELLIGSEISVETFSISGEVYIITITDKLTTGAPHFVEMGHSQPSRYLKDYKDSIFEVASKAIHAVGIESGPSHIEMMITDSGPKLIEIGARLGGDFIATDLVPLSTGVDILAATIQSAVGDEINFSPKIEKASAIRYLKTELGKIKSIDGIEDVKKIKGVIRASMVKSIGDISTEVYNSVDRIGYVISQSESSEEAIDICENAIKRIRIEVE